MDWLYALAYAKLPQGPYENQDIGLGLLSLLQKNDLFDPDLWKKNHNYLSDSLRGWQSNFRNTDDAFFYQPEWKDNALFQFLYSGEFSNSNYKNSLQWLLLQSPSDGFPLRYNQPAAADIAGSMLQSNSLFTDPEHIWLAGRSLDYAKENKIYLSARPGAEISPETIGRSPDEGSCLIYGDSGVPNRQGPLSPDKIVFRDGWLPTSKFLELNLRFTGWHRYKATNSIILYYKNFPIIIEQTEGVIFDWLPEGRSLFRDKRIPRENLNGLIIEKNGMSYVTSILTGIGGPWAQDPPFNAKIDDFKIYEDYDYSRTTINNWRGWSHQREIYFYHHGPTIIIDQIDLDNEKSGGIVWNFNGWPTKLGNDYYFNQKDSSTRIMFVPLDDANISYTQNMVSQDKKISRVSILNEKGNPLKVVTIILDESFLEAKINKTVYENMTMVTIVSQDKSINIPIEPFDEKK